MDNLSDYTNKLYNKIKKNPRHTLPLEDAVNYIRFFGLINLMNSVGQMGCVGNAAIKRIDKAFRDGYILTKKKDET